MTIFLGSDHRGFATKQVLKDWLVKQGHQVEDEGAATLQPDDDYPRYAFAVGNAVRQNAGGRGVLFCGSGAGMVIAANKIAGIRCGQAMTIDQVRAMRQEDDINVLVLATDYTSVTTAQALVAEFLNTIFDGIERHQRRLDQIAQQEK